MEGSGLRWRRAIAGGGEQSQVEGPVSGGGNRSPVEGSGLKSRWNVVSGAGERSKVEGSGLRWRSAIAARGELRLI